MKYKTHSRIFIDASYSFANLMPYYDHMTALLQSSSKRGKEFRERLKLEHKQKNRGFDEQFWQKTQKI